MGINGICTGCELTSLVDSVEQLLFLAWRHLDLYLADTDASVASTMNRSRRFAAESTDSSSKGVLRERSASALIPALETLEKLDVGNFQH